MSTSQPSVSPSSPGVPYIDLTQRKIAYFSMEIALAKELPTYSGGLGMLAGDTLRSAADTGAPMVAVTLVHRRGYFQQHLDAEGNQTESPVDWDPTKLPKAGRVFTMDMQGRRIKIQAWRFDVVGCTGHVVPVYMLDSDVEGNDPFDRTLTNTLYGGDNYYRLCQEALLGLGGIYLLHALGCQPEVCHMNEGHAALLTIGLLENRMYPSPLAEAGDADMQAVRQHCVFTTHTPVPAGHDQFGLDQMHQVLGPERSACIERFGCLHNGMLNMSYLALKFSRYVNGVAMQHGKVSQQMFPEYEIKSITNGVHAATWLGEGFQRLFDKEIPEWRHDNSYFRSVYGIPPITIATTHRQSKRRMIDTVKQRTGVDLNDNWLTLGFARRAATYKRMTMIFTNPQRLAEIAEKIGGLQIVYSGKAHPADNQGKALIKEVINDAQRISNDKLKIVYLENYDWELGAQLTQGVDVWVNTPARPYEASGTSGMKAALNGVPSLSVLDGWWIEGCAEGITGWAIEDGIDTASEANNFYHKLETAVAPLFNNAKGWARLMQHTIAMNGTFFNTHRMLGQYVSNAYFPLASSIASQDEEIPDEEAQVETPVTAEHESKLHENVVM